MDDYKCMKAPNSFWCCMNLSLSFLPPATRYHSSHRPTNSELHTELWSQLSNMSRKQATISAEEGTSSAKTLAGAGDGATCRFIVGEKKDSISNSCFLKKERSTSSEQNWDIRTLEASSNSFQTHCFHPKHNSSLMRMEMCGKETRKMSLPFGTCLSSSFFQTKTVFGTWWVSFMKTIQIHEASAKKNEKRFSCLHGDSRTKKTLLVWKKKLVPQELIDEVDLAIQNVSESKLVRCCMVSMDICMTENIWKSYVPASLWRTMRNRMPCPGHLNDSNHIHSAALQHFRPTFLPSSAKPRREASSPPRHGRRRSEAQNLWATVWRTSPHKGLPMKNEKRSY